MPDTPIANTYRFEDFELEPKTVQIRRSGEPIRITLKAFDLLVYLIENRDRVVSKGELLKVVWEDAFVTENALARAIARLRETLRDRPSRPEYIRTVHKKGYQFCALVEVVASDTLAHGGAKNGSSVSARSDAVDPIAEAVSEAICRKTDRRFTNIRVLWVDDCPANNDFERVALETHGIEFDISTSTVDALARLLGDGYAAIISDMVRLPDARAGYTLLEALRQYGNETPFFIYSSSGRQEHIDEARLRGAQGATNRPTELFDLVLPSISFGFEAMTERN